MNTTSQTIFTDRRKRQTPIPSEYDRRQSTPKEQEDTFKPWWLKIEYATELTTADIVLQDEERLNSSTTPLPLKSA